MTQGDDLATVTGRWANTQALLDLFDVFLSHSELTLMYNDFTENIRLSVVLHETMMKLLY